MTYLVDPKFSGLVSMDESMEVGKTYAVILSCYGQEHKVQPMLCNEIKQHGIYSRSYFMTCGDGFIFQWQRRILGHGSNQSIVGWHECEPLAKVL